MNEAEILVDLSIIRKNVPMLNADNRRLTVDMKRQCIQFKSSGDELRVYNVLQFANKHIKSQDTVANSKALTINLDENNEANGKELALKINFKVPYDNMADYVANSINKMITDNKDNFPKAKPKFKIDIKMPAKPATGSLTIFNDPHKDTSIINKTSVSKDLQRRGFTPRPVSSLLENNAAVNRPGKRPNVTLGGPMVSASDPIDSAYRTFPKKAHIQDPPSPVASRSRSPPASRPIKARVGSLYGSSPSFQSANQSPTGLYTKSVSPANRALPSVSSFSKQQNSYVPYDEVRNRRLVNTGNSCFLNSTWQALAACPGFVHRCTTLLRRVRSRHDLFRLEKANPDIELGQKFTIFEDFLHAMYKLSARRSDKIYQDPVARFPDQFRYDQLREIRAGFEVIFKHFNMYDQQDAHEYLITLFGIIDDQMDELRKEDGIQKDPKTNEYMFGLSCYSLNPVAAFQMRVETTYVCQNCESQKTYSEIRNDIGLGLCGRETLQSLLDDTSKWVAVEKECEKCKHKVASSFERIVKFPKNLCINLKRYERAKDAAYTKKQFSIIISMFLNLTSLGVMKEVEFPELDISVVEQKEEEPEKPVEIPEDVEMKENMAQRLRATLGSGSFGSPVKVYGGKPAEEANEEDVTDEAETSIRSSQVDVVEIKNAMTFKVISDKNHLMAIREKFGLILKDGRIDSHLMTLQKTPEMEIDKMHKPARGKTVDGDGNCFYRAISWYLTGSEESHFKLRHANFKFITKYADYFKRYVSDIDELERIEDDGNWSGACEIFAMAALLNVDIYTFNRDGWRRHQAKEIEGYEQPFEKNHGAIYLTNRENIHYDPVTSLTSSRLLSRDDRKRRQNDGDDGEKEDKYQEGEEREKDRKHPKSAEKRRTLPRSCKGKKLEQDMDEESDQVVYSMVAAVCHLGDSPEKGHYIAYTRDFARNVWYKCNDDEVTEVNLDEVTYKVGQTGYLLFYNRQPPSL